VIYVEVDQISCVHCSRPLTKYLNLTEKQFKNLKDGECNLHREGRCYRNSKHSPGQAEKFAFEKAGEVLLDLSDDEASFNVSRRVPLVEILLLVVCKLRRRDLLIKLFQQQSKTVSIRPNNALLCPCHPPFRGVGFGRYRRRQRSRKPASAATKNSATAF
jgi:hypothetical protein